MLHYGRTVKRAFLVFITLVLVLNLFGCISSMLVAQGADKYADSFVESIRYHDNRLLVTTSENGVETVLLDVIPDIVPQNFTEQDIINYYNKYGETWPLGEAVQTILSVKFTEDDFEAEVERISSISAERDIIYDEENFNYPAYVTALGWNKCSEYVLVDEKECVLHYVFLQRVNGAEINIDSEYLPLNYSGYGNVDGVSVCIYE